MHELGRILTAIDGRGYKAYKGLEGGQFGFPGFRLQVDHVQGDPYAAPSRLRAVVPWRVAQLPAWARSTPVHQRAARDFLARAFREAARQERALSIDAGSQTVLDRSACLFGSEGVELRFFAELPAAGRRILGRKAARLLVSVLPGVVARAATAPLLDLPAMASHCETVENQVALRQSLGRHDLVAFLAEGSRLPRRSGIDDRPLVDAIPFTPPESLRITLGVPNGPPVTGLGIPVGITLIVGGGFHGKSTLLRAIEQGVYDHVPGDGREGIVTDPTAVKVRSEDGRSVSGVDISPFIDNLPFGKSTTGFSTELASGSTSQAASLQEAMEAGTRLVLVDEDTSATNFMIRDERMQALVSKEHEPITPFVDRIRELRDALGVSTILVMGGSGDYFDHANTVLQMDSYLPRDVTEQALEISRTHRTGRREEHAAPLKRPGKRVLDPRSLKPQTRPGRVKIGVRGLDTLILGRQEVDLRGVEQLVDPSQIRTIGWILARLASQGRAPLEPIPEILAWLDRLSASDWDRLTGHPDGDLAMPRPHEVMAALNRVRGARFVAGAAPSGDTSPPQDHS